MRKLLFLAAVAVCSTGCTQYIPERDFGSFNVDPINGTVVIVLDPTLSVTGVETYQRCMDMGGEYRYNEQSLQEECWTPDF